MARVSRSHLALSITLPLLLTLPVLAAPPSAEYSHRVWRIEDGLPQNRIRALTQTPDGYLWIGTSEGLARFDGAHFTVFDRSNTDALRDDSILALSLAADGTLWVGTEGGGLVRYKSGVFRNYGASEGLTNLFVRSIHEDRNKTLWAGTDRGFFRFDNGHFTRLDNTPEVPLASVGSIAEDAEGHLWMLSSNMLLTMSNGKLVPFPFVCSAPALRGLRASADGTIWVLHASGASRVTAGCPVPDPSLPSLPIRSLAGDSEGHLWIGTTGHGLLRLAAGHTVTFDASAGLPDKTVNAIFEDRDHSLWIGCEDGLLRLSRSSVGNIGSADGLEDENVLTVYPDRSGNVWLTTLTGQVYVVSGSAVTRHRLPAPATDLQIRTVFEDSHGTRWFGTFGTGILHETANKVVQYTKKDGVRGNTVRQILEDSSGNIWFALESGVTRWNGTSFRNYYLEDGLSYPSTRCLLSDAKGDVLVCTDAGLNRIHNGSIVRDNEFAALAKEKIWAIHQDTRGTFWIGTRGGGLLRFNSGKLTRFTRDNGLPSDTILQIVADGAGKLWLSTSSGIASADLNELQSAPRTGAQLIHVTPFGTADGMTSSQMNGGVQPAGARSLSGDLWFPGVKGAVRINPADMPGRRMPPVTIERVVADNQPLPVSDAVTIPPGHGRVEIDFTLCDLMSPQRVGFRYKLENFDENWTSTSRTRSATYTNLPPGRYRFRVMAMDPASSSSVSEAILPFTLQPSFYQTDWFYSLLALATACVVWAGFALYARQTRARYNLLLAERTRLAREMHDTVIQGCVGVSTLLEASAGYRKRDAVEADKLLDHARLQVINTLEEAREAVWDLRHAPLTDSSIAMLFGLARTLGEEHGIQIETATSGKGSPDPETDRTILLVGREALRNAITHANASKIGIQLTFRASEVELKVSDDGAGFEERPGGTRENKHFGLIGMRERVEEAGGSYVLETSPGQGTTVTAKLPLTRSA